MKLINNIAISDSGFIFNPGTGDSFSVNPLGQQILLLIKDGKEADIIVDTITNEYSIDKDTVERDVDDFIKLLSANHIISLDIDE